MTNNISKLFELIKSDFSKLDKFTFFSFIKHYIFNKGEVYPYVFWFRIVQFSKKGNWLTRLFFLPISYLILRHYEYKFGIHANSNTHIGKGLHIVHGDGVHINAEFIGDNLRIFQGVTIGVHNGHRPHICDNVIIYPNAVIVGNITLHDNCIIGANAFVSKDVLPNTVVGGVPAKTIKQK